MSQPSNVPIQVGSVITFKNMQYKVIKLFGRGGQGLACLVEDPIGNKKVYKKLVISLGHAKDVRNVRTEFAILIKEDFRHPCLARAEDVSMSSDFITNKLIGEIIMDYYAGGDLSTINRPIPEEQCKKWLYQITLAVQHLHHHGILHRDIKPKNVFLTSKGRDNCDAVLGDFGIARYNEAGAQTMWGTPFYMAPEIVESHFLKHNYDEKVDIWSLGVLGYQMALEEDMESKYRYLCPDGVFSFSLKSNPDKAKTFYDDIRQLASDGKYSKEYVDLLLKMMAMESNQRPSADEILSSEYFKDYKAPLPNNNIVNNSNLNNSLSDSDSSHSMPKPLSNGHMNVPPSHPGAAKSPREVANQPPHAANENNSNANQANDHIREGTIKMVLSYHPIKLATGLAQKMERNTLFVKIYKVINDDKTEKILETEKKTVDHASLTLKWNEIPIIDSSLKLDDVLEFDLYKLKRSIVYPLGREYHLVKICSTIENLKQGMSMPVVKNDKAKGALIIDKLEKNIKKGSVLLRRDGSVGLAAVSNPKMALPKVVGEQSGAVVSPRSGGAQPQSQPQSAPAAIEAKVEEMSLNRSGSKPPKPLPQVPKGGLRASGQGQQLSPGLSPSGSEQNTPNPSPPPIPRSESFGRTRSNSIPAAPPREETGAPKRAPMGLGPAPVKNSVDNRAKRKSDAPPPIREVPPPMAQEKKQPPRPIPKQMTPGGPPKGVSKSSDFGQMQSSLRDKEGFKNQLHHALSAGPKQPTSQPNVAPNTQGSSGPNSAPVGQPREIISSHQQTPTPYPTTPTPTLLMAPTSPGYETPTTPVTPVNQGYNTPISGQSSPYIPHASSAPSYFGSPSEIPSGSHPTALRTPTSPSHIPTAIPDHGVSHNTPIPVQPQVYRSNSAPQSHDLMHVNNEDVMFVTPQLSQVHPNSPYVHQQNGSSSNIGYSSPSVAPHNSYHNGQQQQMNNNGQYMSGPMSPVAHLDNSGNQNQAYYNNGQQQQQMNHNTNYNQPQQMNHNNNYSQPQQQQPQNVYNNTGYNGYNEYQQQQQPQQQQGWSNVVTSPVNSNSNEQQQGGYNNNNYYPNAQPVMQQGMQQNYPQFQVNVSPGTPVQYYVQQPQAIGYPQAAVLPPGSVQVQIQPGSNWSNAYNGGMYYK